MIIIAWTIGSILLLTSLYLSILNAIVFFQLYIQKRPASSWIPLLSGALGVLALILIPLRFANKLAWLPLLLDLGSLPGIFVTIVYHLRRLVRGRS